MKLPIILLLVAFLPACQVVPKQLDDLNQDSEGQFARAVFPTTTSSLKASSAGSETPEDPWWVNPRVSKSSHPLTNMSLQNGDLVRVLSLPFEELGGLYQVTAQGNIDFPFIGSLHIADLSLNSAKTKVESALKKQGWFKEGVTQIQLSITEDAPISVGISGSVFNPGQTVINAHAKQEVQDEIRQRTGSFTRSRNLLNAISAVGGIRPDADLKRVYLKRSGDIYQFDLSGIFSGKTNQELPDLQNHDQVYIRSLGYEQLNLIRPSLITPPGMRVFMSNLTAPALGNAQSSIGSDSSRVPYGVSLIDVAISANCMGGTQMANASRSVILVTSNYGSKQQLVIQRRVDDLLKASTNPQINPYLMPNDAIACYDSKFTNFRDVARGLSELVSPLLLGALL